ncbi:MULTISPECIES: miniconductance mechanosensitive channel MscM [unclassified Arsenophonus]|uniref:miniconductance mechanosensitive channel MscM n=1 Tax=unclassified Arsenophonus TaxID=2627083 RepID=UPI00285D83E6|nr:miniconductance mechanosensitive channel MscM [Arsenophonus sp.]MDR5609474.1 miniconductance mechanosensitive channel MscM [Arsenophonus sp.]MDR5613204.1 miniconductance mechanosensitive channel MscM [Arsenophonus sp.]
MRLIVGILFSLFFITIPAFAAINLDEIQIKKEIKQLEANKNSKNAEIIQALQVALNWLSEAQESEKKTRAYQEAIDDFPKIIKELQQQFLIESNKTITIPTNITILELEQRIVQASSQLLEQGRQIQQEQDRNREISDSLVTLPQQLLEARRLLSDSTVRLQSLHVPVSPLAEAQYNLAQTEVTARKSKTNELEIAQLSANNRQEIARLRIELFKKRYQQIDQELQQLRNHLNFQRQQKAQLALKHTEMLAAQGGELPKFLTAQLQLNRKLSQRLNEQAYRINDIEQRQRQTSSDILTVRQALGTIREQAQWLSGSTTLGEALRAQLYHLPEIPKNQQIDREIINKRVDRLQYQDMLENLDSNNKENEEKQAEIKNLTPEQTQIYDSLIQTRKELLSSIISGYDSEILELTKLYVAATQLTDALTDIKDATHRYMFWIADTDPISLNYPITIVKNLTRLLSLDTLSQLSGAIRVIFASQDSLLYLLAAVAIVIFSISTHQHYNNFLLRASTRIGKVTQDRFALTLRTVFWSILIALPLPILWSAIGYGLQSAWQFPMATAIGSGVRATTPVLWVFMISATFALPNGLFISHFGWSEENVKRAMRYYKLSIFVIVPLMMALITFEYYNDREFAPSLGRLCFLLLCIALSLITHNLKRVGVPLYLDRHGSGENAISNILWLLLIIAPIFSAVAALLGYLSTSQELLARLETSVAIWFFLLIIYHIIRRWMSIQRRKIAFERAKQRRADILAQRAKDEGDNNSSGEGLVDIEESAIDLDTISAQSLGLVRSILTMVALVSLILIWSELHSAFSFLENIRLWNVTTTVNGVDTIQPITLSSLFITILIIIITAQLIRNLPALLELALLQHLDLTPGTGYAITTLTKYTIALIGSLVGFSMLGIEWSKLQWLIAAMGVGLGFGLQEIFANIISGLMILFEKPIRIGDTVTIRDLTGSITKINTRATTLTDRDRKEIIVPNKAFITEQFINWSLSDTITRIVLTIPAPADVDSTEISQILLNAAEKTPMILTNPAPEVYLVDLQQGIQIFELRIYAAEMGHRMPARHEVHQNILIGFAQHGITLPFPPFQARVDIASNNLLRSATKNTSGRKPARKAGEL